jgi:hypothetical protein
MFRFPDIQPGDPFKAEQIEALYKALRELQVYVAPPLYMPPGQGNMIVLQEQGRGDWIKLVTSQGNAFSWVRQIPQDGGGFQDDQGVSGGINDDPAKEINGQSKVPKLPWIVRAWRDPKSNVVLFQLGQCNAQ